MARKPQQHSETQTQDEAVDFRDILSRPLDDVKAPPLLPAGSYEGLILSHKYDKSREKQTPFVEFAIRLTGPANGQEVPEGLDLTKRTLRKTFYLTADAAYRCKDFLTDIGVEVEGKTFQETIPEANNRAVLLEVSHRANPQRPSEPPFTDVGKVTAL